MNILAVDGVPVPEMRHDAPVSVTQKVKILQQNGEDFEFYPTTDEILEAFSTDLYRQARQRGTYRCDKEGFTCNDNCYNNETEKTEVLTVVGSLLDVGAGDGRVFNAIKDPRPGIRFCVKEKYGIEKARAQSDDLIRKGVFIIGRDFFDTTLIDKRFSVIFSNPPYSIYEEWTLRLLREAGFAVMYLVLPVRWEANKEIGRELKNYSHEVLGEYDFAQGDRAARARVNLIRITHKERTEGSASKPPDPFVRWIEENIGRFEETRDAGRFDEEERWLKTKAENTADELVEQYNYEMQALIEGFQAIGKLPERVIKSIGLNKASIITIIRQNIEGLKSRFWAIAFNRLEPINQRLTFDTRQKLAEEMHQFKTLDFSADNIYSIIVWVIENFNKYTNEQIVAVFNALTEPDYIKAYKSNRHWDKDTWRYGGTGKNPYSGSTGKGKPERYILDYRFVARSQHGVRRYNDRYSIIDDLIVVLRSLGATIDNFQKVYPDRHGEPQEIEMYYRDKMQTAFVCRFYQNGNVHVKMNQELMMRFNIEVARILGWIRGPQDIQDEFEVSEDKAAEYWREAGLKMLGVSDLRMLECKEAV
jgi:hypothetical protein